jgi:RNA polymerase sigma factor (sigma-70 family)
MQTKSDAQLLRDYAAHGSEPAFAGIVARHTDLVYSAAWRQTGSPELAREIAQTVFTDLARKARAVAGELTPDASLTGWLYRSTRYEVLTVLRDERRRQAHQRLVMEHFNPASDPAPDWQQIAPVLDEAMAELGDADREAVLLRYFQNQDFHAVGRALGVSDDAAQKRVSRAVERLREFLAQRGVTLGAQGLVVVLAANAVTAAPAGLSAALAAAALAGTAVLTTATATIGKAIAMTTMQKSLITAAIVAASVGASLVVQHQANKSLRAENAVLRAQTNQLAEVDELRAENQRLAKLQTDADELARLRKDQGELLRLRGEVTRLRGLEAELAKLREESLRQQAQSSAASAATEVAFQKFQAQRAVTINAMKRVGLQLRVLANQNNLNSAFTDDGNLNPDLLTENRYDLRKVELLVNDPSQLGKLFNEAPPTIVARTLEAIPTPDGRWLRFYTMTDGSVQNITTENPNQAFTGNWQLKIVKPRP